MIDQDEMMPKERWLAVLWRETPEIFFNGFDRDEHHDLRRHPHEMYNQANNPDYAAIKKISTRNYASSPTPLSSQSLYHHRPGGLWTRGAFRT
ncbi:MAG: hypothetical protein JSW42_01140 [Chloroflexota bacterium]|nr:MAG: hypothetical protein JSW42_01140 [Chloroflexota bacterium]